MSKKTKEIIDVDKIKNVTKTDKRTCCNCKKELNALITIDGEKEDPREDDINLCFYCGEISIFDDKLNSVPISATKLKELEKEKEWVIVQEVSAKLKAKYGQ